MAPKNPISDQQPPPPELEESSESSSEEEESVSNKHIPPPEPETMKESSEQEEEESSEEEGEEEGIKVVTPPKPTSKDSKSISKHPFEAEKDDESDLRGKKKAKVNAEEFRKDSSSGGAGRVWGEEDVIDLLQSMIDFKDEKGVDPSSNMPAFYDFARGKLQFEFSNTQIYEKIRRLRIKFFNNMEKYEKGGEDLVFHKRHEAETFDLSKKIWGKGGDGMINKGVDKNVDGKSNNGYNGKAKKGGKTVRSVDKNAVKELGKDDHEGDFESKYPFLSHSIDMDVGGGFLRENISLIGDAKAKDLEGKWKKFREAEVEVLLMKMDLMKEHTKLVLEGMKESN
nr:STOREKEEPER protein-like [Coffea arabica]